MIAVKIPAQDSTVIKIKTENNEVKIKTENNEVKISSQPVINTALSDVYDGEYTVEPSFEPITLDTKFKSMLDDITVKEIPVWETSNNSGGTTCLIGGNKYYGL